MNKSAFTKITIAVVLLLSNVLFGFPADILINKLNDSKIVDNLYLTLKDPNVVDERKSLLPTITGTAQAANFSMRTGYYIGTGASQSISGLGFQPNFVFIKADTAAGAAAFKTSSMPAANIAFVTNTADLTTSQLTLNADGFTVGTNASVNSSNVRYTWMAFAGSDCTASGTFCVGQYTGNASSPRTINTGFQPSAVIIKRTTAIGAHFHTAAQPNNESLYLYNAVRDTTGNYIRSFAANGFVVGHSGTTGDNVNGGVYNYIAFKTAPGVFAQGTHTGNATDNRNITGVGFQPDAVLVKNATNATANNTRPVLNSNHSYGDYASVLTATANAVNYVQALQSDGFQVGTNIFTNGTGDTYYWMAFGGEANPPPGSGTFEMATGSYSGNGASQNVSGVGFSPDLVIIKDNSTNQSVFRTGLMAANNTAYLANAAANFTGGVTALGSDGFSVGSSTAVNGSGGTYHWQAFGNAYKPTDNSGATDFIIGAYMGNGIDNRSVINQPWQPDLISAKRNSTTAGTFRTSAMSGDLSGFFAATAEGGNRIQALNADGFQIGTNANVNTAGSLYHWFGFKSGENFTVGSYTGTSSAHTISTGFQPDLVWVKRSTAVNGVHRGASVAGDNTQYFNAVANAANRITGTACNVFAVGGNQTETNTSGGTYRYAAWRVPIDYFSYDIVDSSGCGVSNPSYSMTASDFSFECGTATGIMGDNGQRLRVNSPSNASWNLTIAATGGGALWRNGGNTSQYDYNDGGGSPPGCADTDGDNKAGQLTLDPTNATITPQSGCTATNISPGSATGFSGVTPVTLFSAVNAQMGCYWDFTDIDVSQSIPGGQPGGETYSINLTLTGVAF